MDKDLIAVFKTAILNEVEGQKFYEMAASQINDTDAKTALLQLAAEEVKHQQFLKDELKSLHEKSLRIMDYSELKIPALGVFCSDKLDVTDLASAMSVFSIGMRLEQEAQAYYLTSKASLGGDLRLEILFDKLAKWEGVHYEYFKQMHDACYDQFIL